MPSFTPLMSSSCNVDPSHDSSLKPKGLADTDEAQDYGPRPGVALQEEPAGPIPGGQPNSDGLDITAQKLRPETEDLTGFLAAASSLLRANGLQTDRQLTLNQPYPSLSTSSPAVSLDADMRSQHLFPEGPERQRQL